MQDGRLFQNRKSMTVDRITVKVRMKPYLKAFIMHKFEEEPVFFPKKDKLNALLYFLIQKQPAGYIQKVLDKKEYLEITLPYFEDRNINYYNHLSERSQVIIERRIRELFFVTFTQYMDQCFLRNISKVDSVSSFIELYNLPYTSGLDDMLRKELYRSKRMIQKWPLRDYNFSKNISSD